MTTIKVRFAPSPTGYLHIGGARTALYNWLFARKNKGVFILRIEDTDELRSTDESVRGIVDSLKWLGLPSTVSCFQMQRLEIYKKYAEQLLAEDKAYYCYCTPEELAKMRTLAGKSPEQSPKYDRRCLNLTPEERKKKESEGRKPAIRYKIPDQGITRLVDIIHGEVEFENKLLDDFIILKATGVPTYNFAVVIDDHEMDITHVIRGVDHLSNTPKQILLYSAFGWTPPKFAHLSMILGPDGTRLSKRHGASSVLEYKQMGYLPETIVNYLALLGWSTEDSQQIFSPEELIEKFSLERCSKSTAIFDQQKLLWMNGEYIRKMPPDELIEKAGEFLPIEIDEHLEKAIGLEQKKIKLLKDIPYLIEFFIKDKIEYQPKAIKKISKYNQVKQTFADLLPRLNNLDVFSKENLENLVRKYAEEKNCKPAAVFHPLRVAVSGRMEGPGLFDLLELLGKEKVLKRINQFVGQTF